MQAYLGHAVDVELGPRQDHHLNYLAKSGERTWFVRAEAGPEGDVYLQVEAYLQHRVQALGVKTPRIYHVDTSRADYPFAWSLMEHLPVPDLHHHEPPAQLSVERLSKQIGEAIGRWQSLRPSGFGPFQPLHLKHKKRLIGYHEHYADYFFLHLERHLRILTQSRLITFEESIAIEHEIIEHSSLLELKQGCLVHKDLALWNILGTPTDVHAFIDWDDAISGDPMDVFSVLACYQGADWILPALEAYQATQPLPEESTRRFWLHLLRNMISKAVIRVGCGYFNRDERFFLTPRHLSLKAFTRQRLIEAWQGLRQNAEIDTLSTT